MAHNLESFDLHLLYKGVFDYDSGPTTSSKYFYEVLEKEKCRFARFYWKILLYFFSYSCSFIPNYNSKGLF